MSSNISSRNQKTGQVVSHDKSGRISDSENYAMIAIGADAGLREYMGSRSDDMVAKQELFKQIQTYGTCSLEELPYDISNKTALNYLDVLFTGMHVMTDLVTPGMATIYTQNEKKQKDLQQEKYKK